MREPEEDRKVGIEGWIDERIQLALAGLAHPFEKRIARLRERIQKLQIRVQRISRRFDEESLHQQGDEKPPGKESP